MKSIPQQSSFFTLHPVKSQKEETGTGKLSLRSPYLRAILTDKRSSGPAKVLSIANSSMEAALRYITGKK